MKLGNIHLPFFVVKLFGIEGEVSCAIEIAVCSVFTSFPVVVDITVLVIDVDFVVIVAGCVN